MEKVSGLYLEREEVKRRLSIPGEGGDMEGGREGGGLYLEREEVMGRRSIPGKGGGEG